MSKMFRKYLETGRSMQLRKQE